MSVKEFAVLDIGSGSLRFCHVKYHNKQRLLISLKEVGYDGFCDGEILEPENFLGSIDKALENYNRKITLYVGVPAEFCAMSNKRYDKDFVKPVKITEGVVDSFKNEFEKQFLYENMTLINSEIFNWYEDGQISVTPLRTMQQHIGADFTAIFCYNKLLDLLREVFVKLDIKKYEFVLSLLAQSNSFISESDRKNNSILIDSGFLTTSVAVANGNGLKQMIAFSLGGGHITAEMSNFLKLPFNDAEMLKKKVLLTVDPTEIDYYEVESNGQYNSIPARQVNRIVNAKIEQIGKTIKKCLTDEKNPEIPEVNIYFTGGLSNLKGARESLSKVLGHNVDDLVVQQVNLDSPSFSGVAGLVEYCEKKIHVSFFSKLKSIFKK